MKKNILMLLSALLLSACSAVQYQPLSAIDKIDHEAGYRLSTALTQNHIKNNSDDVFMVMSFSGGGTRAAALGYGVLEEMSRQKMPQLGKDSSMADQVDLVFGVSGGSVLAAAFALEGNDIFYSFDRQFLKLNLQKQLASQVFTASNFGRLVSPEFGRGDLLQEQLNLHLFRGATYGDLVKKRKGPFAVISATDMGVGNRFDFVQEKFDVMCLDLNKLPLARAVAASSAVPLIFAPLTLNNEAGQCEYQATYGANREPKLMGTSEQKESAKKDLLADVALYNNKEKRPYLHLIDGGLTDNLGIRAMLEALNIFNGRELLQHYYGGKLPKKVVVINVNAQTEMSMMVDQSAAIPKTRQVAEAIVNIPIDVQSQASLQAFKNISHEWNQKEAEIAKAKGVEPIKMYFISLELKDLIDRQERQRLLKIPTRFYLPSDDVDALRAAGANLLQQSPVFQELKGDLGMGSR